MPHPPTVRQRHMGASPPMPDAEGIGMLDIVIVGGGPVGLAFARSLDGTGLNIAVIERQPLAALADPAPDGREIALTHRSIGILKALGAWQRIDPAEIFPLREAQVFDGGSPLALSFDTNGSGEDRLGNLVSNHLIRRALFQSVEHQPHLALVTGAAVAELRRTRGAMEVTLSDGRILRARLLVAADSRFSGVRDRLGIEAEINRLDRTMMCCRVTHEFEHRGIATEWFGHGQTLAMLPLGGRMSSAVLTLPPQEIDRLMALDEAALGAELTRRFEGRLGVMQVAARPHAYPLATTWSRDFAAPRAALIGDAAVGMHPVTAHGFNLGLQGQATLARLVAQAAAQRRNIAAPLLLRRYETAHRLAARPLYAATNLLVRLYTDERPMARLARKATLFAGARLPLVRGSVSRLLMQHAG